MFLTYALWKLGDRVGGYPKSEEPPTSSKLSPSLKRRLTRLGKEVLETLHRIESPKEGLPWIVSCQHGDSERMMRLFENLFQEEPLSPTDFGMSVHNAIVGTFSIASQNQETHTALSGGKRSFEMGFLEAIALCQDIQGPVGYIYYDTPLPKIYDKIYEGHAEGQYIALIINNKKGDKYIDITLEYDRNSLHFDNLCLNHLLIDYLEGNDTIYSIPYPGGKIVLHRPS